ncbi:hypothetical protein ACFJYA_04220 [Enterococcus faecalis]
MSKLSKINDLAFDLVHEYMEPSEQFSYGKQIYDLSVEAELNPNQQIVLDWLKKEKIKRSTLDILIIRELAELIYHGYFSEELVYKAFMEINRKQQAQVLQAFSRWAIEQEEG